MISGVSRVMSRKARPFPDRPRGVGLYALEWDAMQATYEQREIDPGCIANGIGVVCIDGPLEHKGGWWWDNYEMILQRYRDTLFAEEVAAVLLKIDSPGGNAEGLNACVDAMIRDKRKAKKRVYAFCDDGAFSAAYALACVADEIYLPRAGGCGSIGVIARVMSLQGAYRKAGIDVRLVTSGKRKADGNPDAAITTNALKHVQRRVDSLAKIYWKLVSDSRGLSVAEVRSFEANTFYGQEAVSVGLADGVMSLDDVLRYAAKAARAGAADNAS